MIHRLKALFLFIGLFTAHAGLPIPMFGETHPGKYQGYNVVLIIADSLRPDYLGCYNPQKKTSPSIDALARESFVFENAFCPMPLTIASTASVFTSTYPVSHGVRHVFKDSIPDRLYTLAEIARLYGYSTAWFGSIEDPHTGANRSIMRGFEYHGAERKNIPQKKGKIRFIEKITFKGVVEWIRRKKPGPFFVTIHTYVTHVKHYPQFRLANRLGVRPPAFFEAWFRERVLSTVEEMKAAELLEPQDGTNNFQPKGLDELQGLRNKMKEQRVEKRHKLQGFFWDRIIKSVEGSDESLFESFLTLLDSAVDVLDSQLVGTLLEELTRRGLRRKTIVIITADHGDELREHGYLDHGVFLYDESIRVPLIVYIPGQDRPSRIGALVQSTDIMPTILDLLGIPIPYQSQGVSLLSLLRPGSQSFQRGYIVSQSIDGSYAVRSSRWKYIQKPREDTQGGELYDLKDDPGENHNVFSDHPEVVTRMREDLVAWKNKAPSYSNEFSDFPSTIDKQTQENIRKTGYW